MTLHHHPVSLEALPCHRALPVGVARTEYVLLRLRARAAPEGPRPALSVCLAIDTSGSMEGEPLRHVVDSVRRLTGLLDARDALGVVQFNAAASTVSPLRTLTASARSSVERELATLSARGQTNLSGGLAHAALQFGPDTGNGSRRVMLVLSDGQPNVGASTPDALASEVARVRALGISVSTLGYGPSHNDDIMIAVSDAGGGRYAYVPDPHLAGASFARALGAQRDVVLDRVTLTLTPCEGVELRGVVGDARVTVSARGMVVHLPDLAAGDELNVVVELHLHTSATGEACALLDATLEGRDTQTQAPSATRAEARTALAASTGPIEPDAVVATALALANVSRAKARAHADAGRFDAAVKLLLDARQALLDTPGYRAGSDDPLDDAAEALADEIAQLERAPAAADYQKLRKASRDYGDFAQTGTRLTSSAGLARQTPSQIGMRDAMVGAVVPDAWLHVIEGAGAGQRMKLGAETDIGRGVAAGLRVADPRVSRTNSRVLFQGGGFWVIDCGSTHGTRVNGTLVDRAPLSHGDTIAVGEVTIRFERR